VLGYRAGALGSGLFAAMSYRIDALIAVKNQKSADADRLVLPQRYWHGPRLTLTGTF
jgi:hypothetical protein